MWKVIIVMALFVGCCYCIESNESLAEEARATKKKKTSARLIGMILLFIFSKVAVFKAVAMYFLMTLFQKLFYVGGLLLNHFLKIKGAKPSAVYGAPQDYNTVGYSYGPPDHEPIYSQPSSYPGNDLVSSFDWLVNKNIK